jgi:hypothetical protein
MKIFRVFLSLALIFIVVNKAFSQLEIYLPTVNLQNWVPSQNQSKQLKEISLSIKPINGIIPFRKWFKPKSIDPDFIYPQSRSANPKMKIIKPDLSIDPDMIIGKQKFGKKKLKQKKK